MTIEDTSNSEPRNADEARPKGRRVVIARRTRPLSRRASAMLAAATLAIGVAVGAAIGPAPNASFAGVSPALLQHLPEILAAIAGRGNAAPAAHATASAEAEGAAAAEEEAPLRRHRRRRHRRAALVSASAPEASAPSEAQASKPTKAGKKAAKGAKLPAITSVWLIELAGESFEQAQSTPAAAPYITGTLLEQGALASGFSAQAAAAFATDAALLAPTSVGGTPPIVHSIVQPPCPEGAAGAACATPTGALTAADGFLKETLASITTSAAYREHGLVVVTFAMVGVASQQGLPALSSSATLTSKPPAGALVLSPFAKAGTHPTVSFNAASPMQSLQALL